MEKLKEIVIEKILVHQLPLVLLLSGGYAPTVDETVKAHAVQFEVAKRVLNSKII